MRRTVVTLALALSLPAAAEDTPAEGWDQVLDEAPAEALESEDAEPADAVESDDNEPAEPADAVESDDAEPAEPAPADRATDRLDALIRQLGAPSVDDRLAAVRLFAAEGDDLTRLAPALDDESPAVRRYAVLMLASNAAETDQIGEVQAMLLDRREREVVRSVQDRIDESLRQLRAGGASDWSAGGNPDAGIVTYAAAYGAYVGGAAGYLFGEALEHEESDHVAQGVVPGGLLGLGAGVGTGLLLDSQHVATPESNMLMASGSGLGLLTGIQLGRTFIPIGADGDVERIQAAGLAGSMAGTGVGMMLGDRGWGAGQTLHFDLAAGIGSITASGVADMAGLDLILDRQLRAPISLAGGAMFACAAALANGRIEAPEPTTMAIALGHAAWLGAWTPFLFSDDPTQAQRMGGLRVGLGLGYGSALVQMAGGQPGPRSAVLQGVGAAAGNALGAGIPLSMGQEGRAVTVVGPMLATGLAGQAFGAALAPHYDLSSDDAFLLTTLGTWTAYQTAGWSAFAASVGDVPTQPVGYALAAGGAGTLLTMGLAPVLDVPASGSMALLSAGGWGTWAGGWGSHLGKLDADEQWLVTLGAGNVALAASAAAQGLGWRPTWRQVGMIDGMGVFGAAVGGLTGVLFLYDEDDWDPLVASTLVGSGAGLIGGAILAGRAGGDGLAHLPEIPALGLDGTVKLDARPWVDEKGRPGAWVELRVEDF